MTMTALGGRPGFELEKRIEKADAIWSRACPTSVRSIVRRRAYARRIIGKQ